MCMKNININTMTFNIVNTQPLTLRPFDMIKAEEINGNLVVHDFNVLITLNVVLPSKPEDPHICAVIGQEYDVMVRLNHLKSNEGFVLRSYSFKLDDNTVHKVCKPIFEDRQVVSIPELSFPKGDGQYAIKVFIKNSQDSDWFVQSIQTFFVQV